MATYELSITPHYVKTWKVSDALREIFQNAQDQSIVNGAKFISHYDPYTQTLTVENPCSWLDRSTLLLGQTSKSGDDDTSKDQVGQFGEGYKLACLVLLREGKKVIIHNNCYNENWTPVIKSSRRYNGEEVLIFNIDGRLSYKHTTTDSLIFEIQGITYEEWSDYKGFNLELNPPEDIIKTYYGDIILDDGFAGKVYIGSLYVGEMEGLVYGYNVKPSYIQIDRDRRVLPDWDTRWVTSCMWRDSNDSERILKLIELNAPDIESLSISTSNPVMVELGAKAFENFQEENGENAYPVASDDELRALTDTTSEYKPVIVTKQQRDLFTVSGKLPDFNLKAKTTTKGRLMIWLEGVKDRLTEEEINSFNEIASKVWG